MADMMKELAAGLGHLAREATALEQRLGSADAEVSKRIEARLEAIQAQQRALRDAIFVLRTMLE